MRSVIWVQHLLGTGHTVRAATLARALSAYGPVTLVLGARPPATLDMSGLDTVQLTPVHATDATFNTLVTEDGRPYAEAIAERRTALSAAVEGAHCVVTEALPFGRFALWDEVIPVLNALPRNVVRACSIRDVLVRKSTAKRQRMLRGALETFEVVLCHGDPAMVPLDASFPFAAQLGDRLVYTGYVDHGLPASPVADGCGKIVVTAGGGENGDLLIGMVREAAAILGPDYPMLLLRPDPDRVSGMPSHVAVERNRADVRGVMAAARLSVSQAGYNTVLDVLLSGVRAVFVPFAAEGETEQTDRAKILAERGLAEMVPETESGAALADACLRALGSPQRHLAVKCEGAVQSARVLSARVAALAAA